MDLNLLYTYVGTSGRVSGEGGLSPATVRRVHTVLHKAFADAIKWKRYGLLANPADDADPPKAKHDNAAVPQPWEWHELTAFLDHVASDRLGAAWWLLACTGMRRGEVLGLRWDDVDLDAGQLAVRQTIVLVKGTPHFDTPKSNQWRVIDLDDEDVAVLRRWKAQQAQERLAWGPAWQDTGLVFTRENGSLVHPNVFGKRFGPLCAAAGVRRIRLHDLRHTHAALMLADGESVNVVQERLGHATPGFTLKVYGHVMPGQQKAAASKFAARRRAASA